MKIRTSFRSWDETFQVFRHSISSSTRKLGSPSCSVCFASFMNSALRELVFAHVVKSRETVAVIFYKREYIFFEPSWIHLWTLYFMVRLTFDVLHFTVAFDCYRHWLQEEGFECLWTTPIFEDGATGDWRRVNTCMLRETRHFTITA